MPCYAPKEAVSFSPCGTTANIYKPGDFILVHGVNFVDRVIQFGQSIRFKNIDFSKYNHAALVIDTDGTLIEATDKGIVLTHIADYHTADYYMVNIAATDEDRQEAITFARSCLNEGYGFVTILSIAINMLTGMKFAFGIDGQEVCSGLVARALERTHAIFPRDASHIAPADLAKYYLS